MKRAAWGVLLLGVLGFGCISSRGGAQDVRPSVAQSDAGWRRIDRLPPVHQKGAQDCGAAALSSVLAFYRSPALAPAIDREHIDAALRRSPKEGLSAGALRDYARKQGFHAYVFNGQVEDLTHEIEAGRPVIVGVRKPVSEKEWRSHYEVVIGYHRQQQLVLLFDPALGVRQDRISGFVDEWQHAGRTTLVVMP